MEASFLHAIFANLNDKHSIIAYADWLQERGDPLGELIATKFLNPRAKIELPNHVDGYIPRFVYISRRPVFNIHFHFNGMASGEGYYFFPVDYPIPKPYRMNQVKLIKKGTWTHRGEFESRVAGDVRFGNFIPIERIPLGVLKAILIKLVWTGSNVNLLA